MDKKTKKRLKNEYLERCPIANIVEDCHPMLIITSNTSGYSFVFDHELDLITQGFVHKNSVGKIPRVMYHWILNGYELKPAYEFIVSANDYISISDILNAVYNKTTE